jgi:hypothetical protein
LRDRLAAQIDVMHRDIGEVEREARAEGSQRRAGGALPSPSE